MNSVKSEQTTRLEAIILANSNAMSGDDIANELDVLSRRLDATEARLGEVGSIGQRLSTLEALRCDRTARNVDEWLATILNDLDALKGKLRHENLKALQHVLENLAACLPDHFTAEVRSRVYNSVKPAIDSFAWGERKDPQVVSTESASPPPADGAEEMAERGVWQHVHTKDKHGFWVVSTSRDALVVTIAQIITSHAADASKALREELETAHKRVGAKHIALLNTKDELAAMKARAEKAEAEVAELNERLALSSQLETTALEEVVGLRVLLTARERRVEELEGVCADVLDIINCLDPERDVRLQYRLGKPTLDALAKACGRDPEAKYKRPPGGVVEVLRIDEDTSSLSELASQSATPPPAPTGEIERIGDEPLAGSGIENMMGDEWPRFYRAISDGGHYTQQAVCKAFARRVLHRAGTASRWRDAEREKPEERKSVLAISPGGVMFVSYYCAGYGFNNNGMGRMGVTHWMPLPDPPASGRSAG